MSNLLHEYLFKSEAELDNASILLREGKTQAAVSCCYYAYFWVVRRLLHHKGILVKAHSGARDRFALHYIKPGDVPKQYGGYLQLLFDERQIADYDLHSHFSEERTKEFMAIVRQFLDYVKGSFLK